MSRISSKSEKNTRRIICLPWWKITKTLAQEQRLLLNRATKNGFQRPLTLLKNLHKVLQARLFVMLTTKVCSDQLLLIRRHMSCRPYLPTTPTRKHLSNFRTIRCNPILRTCSHNKVVRGHFSLCWITSTENTMPLPASLKFAKTPIKSRSKILALWMSKRNLIHKFDRLSHPWLHIRYRSTRTWWKLFTTRKWFPRESRPIV